MPNNICHFALVPMTKKEKIKEPAKALEKLGRVCNDIKSGIVRKRGWNPVSTLLGKS